MMNSLKHLYHLLQVGCGFIRHNQIETDWVFRVDNDTIKSTNESTQIVFSGLYDYIDYIAFGVMTSSWFS